MTGLKLSTRFIIFTSIFFGIRFCKYQCRKVSSFKCRCFVTTALVKINKTSRNGQFQSTPSSSTATEISHFEIVEKDGNPPLNVLCILSSNETMTDIRKIYQLLSTLINPEKFQKDRRAAERSIKILSCTMKIASIEKDYHFLLNKMPLNHEFRFFYLPLFSLENTKAETELQWTRKHCR